MKIELTVGGVNVKIKLLMMLEGCFDIYNFKNHSRNICDISEINETAAVRFILYKFKGGGSIKTIKIYILWKNLEPS